MKILTRKSQKCTKSDTKTAKVPPSDPFLAMLQQSDSKKRSESAKELKKVFTKADFGQQKKSFGAPRPLMRATEVKDEL